MRRFLTYLLTTLLFPFASFAQDDARGLDDKINDFLAPYATKALETALTSITLPGNVDLPIVIMVLVGGAIYFTFYFGFVNITRFWTAINVVRGKYDAIDGAEEKEENLDMVHSLDGDVVDTIKVDGAGEVSHFQALTAALSATVGLGNIGGVAVAISLGGPGATFWMIIAGFLGMSSKFVECTLGVKYRDVGPDGTIYGGPMYYLKKGFQEKGGLWTSFGKVLATLFAIMCVAGSFGGGNMFQSNQASALFMSRFGIESGYAGVLFGSVMALLVGIVIIGGIKRIGSMTEKIVPFMCGTYLLAAIIIILMKIDSVPMAFGLIFKGAFSPEGIAGGFLGVLVAGFQRAAFSNEAGVGSAAIAHSAVKTNYPASEGVVALLEPFIDTVIVCTITALVIIITNVEGGFLNYGVEADGVTLTSTAFDSVIPGFSWILLVAVILFAFSSMLSWSYYGLQAWMYLFGRNKIVENTYKILFLIFVVIGAAASLGAVLSFSDAMVFAMIFPNMIGIIFLAPQVKKEMKRYMNKINSL